MNNRIQPLAHLCLRSVALLQHAALYVVTFALLASASVVDAYAQHDLGISAISIGSSSGVYSDPQEVTVTVSYEHSLLPWASIEGKQFILSYRVDDGPIVREKAVTLSHIFNGGTAEYTFENVPDLSQGMRTLYVQVSGVSDINTANNMSSIMVESLPFPSSSAVVSEFPYLEDFEAGAGNWTAFAYGSAPNGGTPIGFQLGTPQPSPLGTMRGQLDAAASGVNAWKTNLVSPHYYSSNTLTQVISPVFDFTDIPYLEISLSAFWESNPAIDGASLQSSTDGGQTWTTVGAAGDPDNWYNNTNIAALESVGNKHGWSGYVTAGSSARPYSTTGTPDPFYTTAGTFADGSDVWLTAKNTLQGGEQTQLRFVFNSLPGGQSGTNPANQTFKDFGFAFDDIQIIEGATASMQAALVNDINSDMLAGEGDTIRYSLVIENPSSYDITNVVFNDTITDSFLTLVPGSVMSSSGSIVSGNTAGDSAVAIDIGTLASAANVSITFDVLVGAVENFASEVCGQGFVDADQFATVKLPTNDPASMERADPTCLAVNFVDNDSDGFADEGDPDMDGLTNAEEFVLGTNPNVKDTDGDGFEDKTEVDAGSDPLEPNSVPLANQLTRCADWNGFLANVLTQILEQNNGSASSIEVSTTLFDISGAAQNLIELILLADQQFDLIVNDLNGFAADTYGTICSTVTTGAAGSLGGQLVSYRFENNGSYSMAVLDPFTSGRKGEQFLSYNTYQPSSNPADASDFVAGWIQVVNEENSAQQGTLTYYDMTGAQIRTAVLSIDANSRRDVDVHSVGANSVGMVKWTPSDANAVFRIKHLRYYFSGAFSGLNDIISLNSIPAQVGSGSVLALPVDTRGKTAVLELSNTTGNTVFVNVKVNSADGANLETGMVTIEPRGTRHVIVNEFLNEALGTLQADAVAKSSIVGSLYYYSRATDGSLRFTEAVPMSDGTGVVYRGSYNTYLGQSCVLQLANRTASAQPATLDMTRADGTQILMGSNLNVPANGAFELNICDLDIDSVYGQLELTPSTPGSLVGLVKRGNVEGSVELSVPLR